MTSAETTPRKPPARAAQPVPPLPGINRAAVLEEELKLPRAGIERTLELLAEGATIPFLARYRKEQTGGLDEVQLQAIKTRSEELAELESRRKTIVESIASQGMLTDELLGRLLGTLSKTELEDLYLPYKPKRRTKAMIARERGLEPLADLLWEQTDTLTGTRESVAAAFVSEEKEVPDVEAAWQGARDIVAERVSEQAEIRATLRAQALEQGVQRSAVVEDDKGADLNERLKYKDYFEFEEPVAKLPSHRILALRRGEKEGHLRIALEVDRDTALGRVRGHVVKNSKAALVADLEKALTDSYDRLLRSSIEVDVRLSLKERADKEAIRVFTENLRHLLLASPLGGKRTLALDPGFRTGCKVVVLDATGRLLEQTVVYPHEPQRQVDVAKKSAGPPGPKARD